MRVFTQYADAHQGSFSTRLRKERHPGEYLPDTAGTRYLYISATAGHSNAVLVCEPRNFETRGWCCLRMGRFSR
jgi:hypothetical protein